MPKYYSPNLVQIPACHGSLACDYDDERRGGGSAAAMSIKEAEAESRREAAATLGMDADPPGNTTQKEKSDRNTRRDSTT